MNQAMRLQEEVNHTNESQDVKPVLLFVDDDARAISLIKLEFEEANYVCHFAESAFKALDILQKMTVYVVISDINMPILSGTELFEQVKKKQPEVIRIAIPGSINIPEFVNAINKASVHTYLVKPHQPKDLKLIIYKELLERKKNRRKIDRIKASQKNAANRARESGASLSKNQGLIEAIQQGYKNLLISYDPTFESKRERYEFRKDLARGIGNALRLEMNTKLQLDMGIFFSCFCSCNKIKALSKAPMDDFMAVAIALAKKDNEALSEITGPLLLSECFKTISSMDTLIHEQELNWDESIKVINSQQSSHDDDVLLALNDLEIPDS
jgi:CheY-like chemotaxis protein|tara:strand:+ start:213 stop:1193 length:981 start_codon:yes stop_codon:yes gene_type:complete